MRLKRLNDKDDTETGHEGIKSQGTPCYSNRVERFKHPLKGGGGVGGGQRQVIYRIKTLKTKEGQNNQHSISPTVRNFIHNLVPKYGSNRTGGGGGDLTSGTVWVCAEQPELCFVWILPIGQNLHQARCVAFCPESSQETSECGVIGFSGVFGWGVGRGGVQSGVTGQG